MNVVGRGKLQDFCKKYADAQKWIDNWLADVEAAQWDTPHHIKERYSSVSFLPHNKVIFNVKGNEYRLEATVAYRTRVLAIQWIGTHAEYDQRNKKR